jgi:hypothetical protein
MLDVRWPTDDNHICVENYRDAVERVLAVLRPRSDAASKRFVPFSKTSASGWERINEVGC